MVSDIIQTFGGVRGYEENDVVYLHIEDVARGLGFTEQKDGVEYVRWRTVDSHLSSLSFATSCESGNPHDYYIPENIFYRLCMKAKMNLQKHSKLRLPMRLYRQSGSMGCMQQKTLSSAL